MESRARTVKNLIAFYEALCGNTPREESSRAQVQTEPERQDRRTVVEEDSTDMISDALHGFSEPCTYVEPANLVQENDQREMATNLPESILVNDGSETEDTKPSMRVSFALHLNTVYTIPRSDVRTYPIN